MAPLADTIGIPDMSMKDGVRDRYTVRSPTSTSTITKCREN